ncbi:putative Multiple inositol polyphosphate phosphatase 1 [Zostera marina]|uniref:Multiple inositol polyphosphate phosphatase 1 n=1 Tax=Zostera marina TaxID=29655 RepID=A0A0K9PPB1_ZOSMR|nr:putative Multiple inositol polyphosphate phosphatase 1 [Zostera marina]
MACCSLLQFGPFLPFLLLSTHFLSIHADHTDEPFDVRRHLSTVTSYSSSKGPKNAALHTSTVPDGCAAIHLNLVARHGTRAPTKKRIKELNNLEGRFEVLLSDVKDDSKVPQWLYGWQSPWKGRVTGGELVQKGEEELYQLGIRVRERFPDLFSEDYNSEIYQIRATQVSRASASAVAFGIGLFSGRGNLGSGRQRAFSVISESRGSDTCLRFFDTCETYKQFKRNEGPSLDKIKEPVFEEVKTELTKRYELNFTREDISSLWFLCKQEATLLDITSQACSLFKPAEVLLLEWTDDLEGFKLKGYGKAVNYRMGVPLLHDVIQSIEKAIGAKEENRTPGTFEKARLRFAHAETIVPFSCLLGLFLDGSEFEKIQREQPMQLPPKPPQKRNWKGNSVAPFAGNNMLVLYSCTANHSKSKYFVQVLHNEVPVSLPGCDNKDFCPFEVFKEKIVEPHLKHDFISTCSPEFDVTSKTCSISCFFFP